MIEHTHRRHTSTAFPFGKWLLIVGALIVASILISAVSSNLQKPFASSEVHFTDASASGLQIVPASCPSDPHSPGECSVPTPTTDLHASCVNNTATLSWTAPAGTTYSALRVHDTAGPWAAGGCENNSSGVPGSWCFNTQSPIVLSLTDGDYAWWTHACNANGCSVGTRGPDFSCGAPPPPPHLHDCHVCSRRNISHTLVASRLGCHCLLPACRRHLGSRV